LRRYNLLSNVSDWISETPAVERTAYHSAIFLCWHLNALATARLEIDSITSYLTVIYYYLSSHLCCPTRTLSCFAYFYCWLIGCLVKMKRAFVWLVSWALLLMRASRLRFLVCAIGGVTTFEVCGRGVFSIEVEELCFFQNCRWCVVSIARVLLKLFLFCNL